MTIAIMNTHYGSQKELPFDLAHRRWPIDFELSPQANKDEITCKKTELARKLSKVLVQYAHKNDNNEDNVSVIESTTNKASYWQEGETLINTNETEDHDDLNLSYHPLDSLCYLRIRPNVMLDDFTGIELNDSELVAIHPFCKTSTWTNSTRNKYGFISYATMQDPVLQQGPELSATTQVFKNREIWGVNSQLIRCHKEKSFYYMGIIRFEIGMIKSLHEYLDKASNYFGYTGLVNIEVGILVANLASSGGLTLALPENALNHKHYIGPIYNDIIVSGTFEINDSATIDSFLLDLFNKFLMQLARLGLLR